MGFSNRQVNALKRKLNKSFIHNREVQGRTLSYIEGWHAIAEANRIFGFEGWDRETVESKCVLGRENRGSYHAVYVAKVRITVRAADRTVVREGHGTGEAQGSSAGETHDRALKTAETDATKRALATFGKPFGLSLYVSARNVRQEGASNPLPHAPPIPNHDRRRTQQQLGRNGRYFVPSRAKLTLDPGLASVSPAPPNMAPGASETNTAASAREDHSARDTSMSLQADLKAQMGAAQGDQVVEGCASSATAPAADLPTAVTLAVPGESRAHDSDAIPVPAGVSAAPQGEPGGGRAGPTNRPVDPSAGAEAGRAQDATSAPLEVGEIGSPPLQPPVPRPVEAENATPRLLIEWPKRRREPAHLDYVRAQPCLLCGRMPSDAHHLRFSQRRAFGRKVSDEFTVPLCRIHHRQLHDAGDEVKWWLAMDRDIDPLNIAKDLWDESRQKRNDDGSSSINDAISR
jgi:hypothetical protein